MKIRIALIPTPPNIDLVIETTRVTRPDSRIVGGSNDIGVRKLPPILLGFQRLQSLANQSLRETPAYCRSYWISGQSAMAPRTAFISGPLDPSPEYFSTHYIPELNLAISAGDNFVIGPVAGVDNLSLNHLLSQRVDPTRICIYMASFEYAIPQLRREFEAKGVMVLNTGGVTTRERDAAMTRNSEYDILRYRSEAEAREVYGRSWRPRVSNTEMNERRRRGDFGVEYRGGWRVEDLRAGGC